MFEFVKAGGWVMIPILLCSVVAMAIIIERLWALRKGKIFPNSAIELARKIAASGKISDSNLDTLSKSSLVGEVLAVGLQSSTAPRHVMKENIEEAGRHAVHYMERYMTALGTIVTISPLLGLFGTVWGMIEVFGAINKAGMGNPAILAGGISQALITTVGGLAVAMPALVFHRYFKSKIDNYVIDMEKEALRVMEISANSRRQQETLARPTVSASAPATVVAAAAAEQAARARQSVVSNTARGL